jgi:hypothetical protein
MPSPHRVGDQPTEPDRPCRDAHGCRQLDVPRPNRHQQPPEESDHDDRLLRSIQLVASDIDGVHAHGEHVVEVATIARVRGDPASDVDEAEREKGPDRSDVPGASRGVDGSAP